MGIGVLREGVEERSRLWRASHRVRCSEVPPASGGEALDALASPAKHTAANACLHYARRLPMIRDDLAHAVRRALADADLPEPPGGVKIEPPKQRDHGDWATNAALALAKTVGRRPMEIAEQLAEKLDAAAVPHLERAEAAPPGFVNLYLRPTWLHDVLRSIVAAGDAFGTSDALAGERINLEFVSANPTGPLHAGGGRWVAVGDAIANLLAAQGAVVHREYYLNDTGNQLNTFRDSLYARYRGEQPPEDGYQGQYLVDMAAKLHAELGDDVSPDEACEWGVQRNIEGVRDDLGRIGVHFDTWFSERTLHERGEVADVLRVLEERGVVYDTGRRALAAVDRLRRLARPRARAVRRHRRRTSATTSRTTATRSRRGWNHLIDIWGADHHGQVKSLQAGMEALGFGPPRRARGAARPAREAAARRSRGPDLAARGQHRHARRHPRRGRSRRRAHDVPAPGHRLAADVRSRRRDAAVDGEPRLLRAVRARAGLVDRAAADRAEIQRAPIDTVDLSPLTHEREIEVLRLLAQYPDVVAEAAATRAPQKVSTWVRDFARAFHGFYRDCRVISPDAALTQARLWLAEASRIGLANALGLLGVSAPTDEMTPMPVRPTTPMPHGDGAEPAA